MTTAGPTGDGHGAPGEFSLVGDASAEDMAAVEAALDAHNAARTGREDFRPVRLALHDSTGTLAGGLRGVTGWDWLYVIHLWVADEHRGAGLGGRLMQEAERIGRERGCRGACLSTYSFQAHPFYLGLGYRDIGRIDDYPAGHRMHFMVKPLDGAATGDAGE